MKGETINSNEQSDRNTGAEILQDMKPFEDHIREMNQKAELERASTTRIEDALTHTDKEWKNKYNKDALEEARRNHEATLADIRDLREMVIESGDFFKDNREYSLGEECTSCKFDNSSWGAMLDGRVEIGDVIKSSTILDRSSGGGWGIESNTVTSAEHGFYMMATNADGETENFGFFSDDEIAKEFSTRENGKYSRETLFKGVQNNTGVEFCNSRALINMQKYKDDETLSKRNSEKQIILVPCDSTNPDGFASGNQMLVGSTDNFSKQSN